MTLTLSTLQTRTLFPRDLARASRNVRQTEKTAVPKSFEFLKRSEKTRPIPPPPDRSASSEEQSPSHEVLLAWDHVRQVQVAVASAFAGVLKAT